MAQEYLVDVTLTSAASIEAESMGEAMDKALQREWYSEDVVEILVTNEETGERLKTEI